MNRLNLGLLVLLALQIGVLAAEKFVWTDHYQPRTATTGKYLFPRAAPESIAELSVKKGDSTTSLVRKGDQWLVASEGDALADQSAVKQAVESLAQIPNGIIVSANPAKHADFDVAGKNAIEVTAKTNSGEEVARFVVGKNTSDFRGVYLRSPADASDVILVAKNVHHVFDKDDNARGAWRDKTIFKSDAKQVREFEIVKADETIVVQRQLTTPPAPTPTDPNASQPAAPAAPAAPVATDDDDWKVVKPVEGLMNRYTGNSLATTVAELKCDGFAPGDKKLSDLGLEPPEARVTAKLADGSTLVFEIGKEEDSKRYVRVPDRSDVYRVMSYRLFNFVTKGAEFPEKKPEAASAPAGETVPAGEKPADPSAPAAGDKPADKPPEKPADKPEEKPAGEKPPAESGGGGR